MKSPRIVCAILAVLLVSCVVLLNLMLSERQKRIRQDENVKQLLQDKDQTLNLTTSEFEKTETAWRHKLDSVINDRDIKLRSIKQAIITRVVYRDTGTVKIVYKDPIKQADQSYKVPINYYSGCWGIKGDILTVDKAAKLNITERTANNSAQLIVTRKLFLGFLWPTKQEQFKAFADCGEISFTKINFVK